MKTSIRTEYRGTLFRSKLEADWAMSFDQLGIPWHYEDRGRYFGTTFYLVDFLLPGSGQFVEVKGSWEPADVRKAQALCLHAPVGTHPPRRGPDIVLVYAGPDGRFWGWPRLVEEVAFDTFLLECAFELALLQCGACGGWYFAPRDGAWGCRCCGASDHWLLTPRFERWLSPWPFTVKDAA